MIRCAQKYGATRTDAACAHALAASGASGPSRKYVEAILKLRREQIAVQTPARPSTSTPHENIRGATYYDKEQEEDDGRNHPEAE
jgi:hypothetical protein